MDSLAAGWGEDWVAVQALVAKVGSGSAAQEAAALGWALVVVVATGLAAAVAAEAEVG